MMCLLSRPPSPRSMLFHTAIPWLFLGGPTLGMADEAAENTQPRDAMIVVVGAGGTDQYAKVFSQWADNWQQTASLAHAVYEEIGTKDTGSANDRDLLKASIAQAKVETAQPLWLVLIGHGTYDREVAKFNLRGPDVAATDLAEWLEGLERPLIVINCSASSGPFLKVLQGKGRVIVTATASGAEQNYARFGEFLSSAWTEAAADLDHDDQISLLEAFLLASSRVARFYEDASRLATEHALLEDNADGKGTSADFFVGIRASKKARDGAAPDGRLAHRYVLVPSKTTAQLSPEQLAERDRVEAAIESLRDRKASFSEDEYYQQLEPLMVELASLYSEP